MNAQLKKQRADEHTIDVLIDVNRISQTLDAWERHLAGFRNIEQARHAWLPYRKQIERALLGHNEGVGL